MKFGWHLFVVEMRNEMQKRSPGLGDILKHKLMVLFVILAQQSLVKGQDNINGRPSFNVSLDILESGITIGRMIFDGDEFLSGFIPLTWQLHLPQLKRFSFEAEVGYLNYLNIGVPDISQSRIQQGYLLAGALFYPILFGENEGIFVSASLGYSLESTNYKFFPDPLQDFKRVIGSAEYFYGFGGQKICKNKFVFSGRFGIESYFGSRGNILNGFFEAKLGVGIVLK
jgi:hypothetical protein